MSQIKSLLTRISQTFIDERKIKCKTEMAEFNY